MKYQIMSLPDAIMYIVYQKEISKNKVASVLGTQVKMVNNYISGETKKMSPEKAWLLFQVFDILLDDYTHPIELETTVMLREQKGLKDDDS